MSVAYTEAPLSRSTSGTGAVLYASPLLDPDESAADKKRTHIVSDVIDPVLRDVLEAFQGALVHQLAGMVSRISLWSRQQEVAASHNYDAFTTWSTAVATRRWLSNYYTSTLSSATITATGATTASLTFNTPSDWHSAATDVIGAIYGNTAAVSQITNVATSIVSALNPVQVVYWSDWLPLDIDSSIDRPVLMTAPAIPLAVTAVEDISDWFGVSAADVFKATGIAKRTYQEWKRVGTRRPRSSSEGRLWELHQVAADLVETMGLSGVRHWVNEDLARRKLLRSGEIDKFASQAYASLARTERRPAWVGAGSPEIRVAPRHGVELGRMDTSDVVEPEL